MIENVLWFQPKEIDPVNCNLQQNGATSCTISQKFDRLDAYTIDELL